MSKHNIDLLVSGRVVDYITKDNLDTDSQSGGARAAVSKLESDVVTEIAKFINQHEGVNRIRVDVEGEMAWQHKDKLVSDARIVVSQTS